MVLSNSSSDRDAVVTGQPGPQRAGVRIPPSGDQPGGVFVVLEMVVLVIVAALAMVAIIVSSGGFDDGTHAATGTVQSSPRASRDGVPRMLAAPSTRTGGRPNASVTAR